MIESNTLKGLRFWVRQALFIGLLVVGLYFVFDPAVPKLYQLVIAFGILGLLIYYFLGGGGSKGDGLKNEEDGDMSDYSQGSSRFPRRIGSSEPTEPEED